MRGGLARCVVRQGHVRSSSRVGPRPTASGAPRETLVAQTVVGNGAEIQGALFVRVRWGHGVFVTANKATASGTSRPAGAASARVLQRAVAGPATLVDRAFRMSMPTRCPLAP